MTAPRRIQLRRTKGWRLPEGARSVARPTRWGNPFRVGHEARDAAEAVELFALHSGVFGLYELTAADLAPLRGCDLACWCPLDKPCHADVLLELANRGSGE